jgi:hypothetical protein
LARPLARHPVVERDRREHQPGEGAAALGVEDDARDEQQPVAIRPVRAGAWGKVQRQQDRQEQEEERRFGKEHLAFLEYQRYRRRV